MRDSSSTSLMRGVGVNPILAWGRVKIVPGEDPVLEHGLGLSATVVDGKLVVQIDPGIRSYIWTPLATVIGSATEVLVESFDEPAGSFVVATVPPPEPPAEEPPQEPPPEEEPAEEPEEPAPASFELAPLAEDGTVYVSLLVLGVGQ